MAVDWVFLSAAMTGSAIAVVATLSGGPENLSNSLVDQLDADEIIFASYNFGRNRLEVLLDEGMESFNDSQTTVRYERFSDPSERTDAQLRNAHRTWSRRVGNPEYENQPRARDMVRILEMAMDQRNVEPHDDI